MLGVRRRRPIEPAVPLTVATPRTPARRSSARAYLVDFRRRRERPCTHTYR